MLRIEARLESPKSYCGPGRVRESYLVALQCWHFADLARDRRWCQLSTMCGRYIHKLTWQQIVNLYRLTLPDEEPHGFKGQLQHRAPAARPRSTYRLQSRKMSIGCEAAAGFVIV